MGYFWMEDEVDHTLGILDNPWLAASIGTGYADRRQGMDGASYPEAVFVVMKLIFDLVVRKIEADFAPRRLEAKSCHPIVVQIVGIVAFVIV
jgi:hypothetical protein